METAYSNQSIVTSVICFGRQLRKEGFLITPFHLNNTLEGLGFINIGEKKQFKALLKATLVSNANELEHFEFLFKSFWDGSIAPPDPFEEYPDSGDGLSGNDDRNSGEGGSGIQEGGSHQTNLEWEMGGIGGENEREVVAGGGFVDTEKDFSQFNIEELDHVKTLVIRLARQLGLRLSRRYRACEREGKIDFRRSFRKALQYGGELLELRYRRPRKIPYRINLLLDISGSMDIYNQFFIMFMYGLQQTLTKAQCFIFSTHLTSVSHHLKTVQFDDAWNRIQKMSPNWSGGTQIGSSMMQLYAEHIGSKSAQRAVVIIVSDGWDCGRPDILGKAMGLIHQRCHHLFWVNPLLSGQNYEPTCSGMQAALSYVDSFLPFDSIASLERLCHKIEAVW